MSLLRRRLAPAHARRLARIDAGGATVMLTLLAGCFVVESSGSGNPADNAEGGLYGLVIGLVLLLPYSISLFIAAGLLRRWPRVGYIAHVIAWNWPFILVIGVVLGGWMYDRR